MRLTNNPNQESIYPSKSILKEMLKIIHELRKEYDDYIDKLNFLNHPLHELVLLAGKFRDNEKLHHIINAYCAELLTLGVNINHKDNYGNTPLHLVVLNNLSEVWINFFIQCGSQLYYTNKNDKCIYELAISEGLNEQTVKMLLDKMLLQINTSIDGRDMSTSNKALTKANEINKIVVRLTLSNSPTKYLAHIMSKANLENVLPAKTISPLVMIIYSLNELNLHHPSKVEQLISNIDYLIRSNPNNLNEINVHGASPMHFAVSLKNITISKHIMTSLIKNGANINATDYYLNTPFHTLCDCLNNRHWDKDNFVEIASFLIENHANIFAEDIEGGRTPFYLFFQNANNNFKQESLEKLSRLFYNKGVNFFAINPLTNKIYFREVSLCMAQAMLDITISDILSNNHIVNKSQHITDTIFESIYSMHSIGGTTKLILFLDTLVNNNIPFDSYFIKKLIHLKKHFPQENISDHPEVLVKILQHYKPSNFDVFCDDITMMCSIFDVKFSNIILEHAIDFSKIKHNSIVLYDNIIKLFKYLVTNLRSSENNIPKIVKFVSKLQDQSICINDDFIKTIIEIKKNSEITLLDDSHVLEKIIKVYEPACHKSYKTNMNDLRDVYDNNEGVQKILKHTLKKTKKRSKLNSYYALSKNIDDSKVESHDIWEMTQASPLMLNAIQTQINNSTSSVSSPLIKTVVNELLTSLSKDLPPLIIQRILQFSPQEKIKPIIKSACLFSKQNPEHGYNTRSTNKRSYNEMRNSI